MDKDIEIRGIEDWPEEEKKIIRDGLDLMHLHKEVEMQSELLSSRYGVSARQFDILYNLFNYPDKMLTPAQLADEVKLTRSTMTGTLDGLEKKGLISREPHPGDRRMMLIKLTRDGLEFCSKNVPERNTHILNAMKTLSLEDRNHLKRIYNNLLVFMRKLLDEDEN